MKKNIQISLKVSLITLFLFMTFTLTGIMVTYSYNQNSEAALNLAEELLNQVNQQVLLQTRSSILSIHSLVDMVPNLPSVDKKPDDFDHSLLPFMIQSLRDNPRLYSIYMGYDDGDFFQAISFVRNETKKKELNAPNMASFGIRRISSNAGGRIESWQFLDNTAQLVGFGPTTKATYDPRMRPWYTAAQNINATTRTKLYVFSSTKSLGITVSHRFSGNHPGVFGVDVTLENVSKFLKKQKVGDNGLVFIFTADGQLTGFPDLEKIIKQVPDHDGNINFSIANINDLNNPVISKIYEKLLNGENLESQITKIKVDNQDYLTLLTPIPGAYSSDEYIASVVPLNDFTGTITRTLKNSLIFSIIIFLASFPFVVLITRSISKSIISLANDTNKIARLNFEPSEMEKSPTHEIKILANALNDLKDTLKTITNFAPVEIIRKVTRSGKGLNSQGEKRNLSFLSMNISNIDKLEMLMEPQEFTELTSTVLSKLGKIITDREGISDRFCGIGFSAFWNAPESQPRHQQTACETALYCCKTISSLNESLINKNNDIIKPGFALHSGQATVGTIKGVTSLNYTALGTASSIARTIASLNEFYGTQILATKVVRDQAMCNFLFRTVDVAQPCGCDKPIELHELVGEMPGAGTSSLSIDSKAMQELEKWETAYALYRKKNWATAYELFLAIVSKNPDNKLAQFYVKRTKQFMKKAPAQDWDGVERLFGR